MILYVYGMITTTSTSTSSSINCSSVSNLNQFICCNYKNIFDISSTEDVVDYLTKQTTLAIPLSIVDVTDDHLNELKGRIEDPVVNELSVYQQQVFYIQFNYLRMRYLYTSLHKVLNTNDSHLSDMAKALLNKVQYELPIKESYALLNHSWHPTKITTFMISTFQIQLNKYKTIYLLLKSVYRPFTDIKSQFEMNRYFIADSHSINNMDRQLNEIFDFLHKLYKNHSHLPSAQVKCTQDCELLWHLVYHRFISVEQWIDLKSSSFKISKSYFDLFFCTSIDTCQLYYKSLLSKSL